MENRVGRPSAKSRKAYNFDALLDVGEMPRFEALRIFAELVEAGVLQITQSR